MNFEFDDFWHQQVASRNEKKFGCSVPWHPIIVSKITKKPIKICNDSTTGKEALMQYRHFRDRKINQESVPCAKIDISLGIPKIDVKDNNENEAYIRMYL